MEEKLNEIKTKIGYYKVFVIAFIILFVASSASLLISLLTTAFQKLSIPMYIVVIAISFASLGLFTPLLIINKKKCKVLEKELLK